MLASRCVRSRRALTVLGNHDVAAIDGHGLEQFNPAAETALEWTQRVLAADHAAWLDSFSYEIRQPAFLMVHGAPIEYFTYISDKADAARRVRVDRCTAYLRRTHARRGILRAGVRWAIAHAHRQHGGRLDLVEGTRYIVNVGSVGQPRDLNPDASFAYYDPDARTIEWQRVAYPVWAVQQKIGRRTVARRVRAPIAEWTLIRHARRAAAAARSPAAA